MSSAEQQAQSSAATRSSAGSAATDTRKVSFQPSSAPAPSRSSSSAHLSSSSTSRTGAATSSSQAYSAAYSGVTRRHSLFGTEDRIVLDIGSRYSKFGFSGEPRPRAIVRSVSFAQPSTSYLRLDASSASSERYSMGETLWDLDFERCVDDQLRRGRRALVLAQLTQLLRNAFTQHLMVDPKQRKVLVVENPMLPNSIKDMICTVLFNNLQVPSVSFVPAPLLSLLAVGRITGFVLEVGYLESTLMPVYYGRPLTSHTVSTTRAGKRLNARLKRLLLRYGKFVAAQASLQDSARSLRERTHRIDPSLLTDDRLEQIKAKALFVSSYDPGVSGLEDLFAELELESTDSQARAAASVCQKYSSASTATPFTFAVTPNSVDPQGTASLIQSVTAPPASASFTLAGASGTGQVSGVIAIPGWLRERAAEFLFDKGDHDDPGLIDMTVSAVSKLPIDLRRTMCENMLVSGGTAMLPGFANRFRTQLAMAIEEAEEAGGQLSIDRHAVRQRKASQQSDDKEKVQGSALHRSVAVLNDPWPDVSQLDHSSKGKRAGQGGSAPAFAANLLAWMGASLAGALKTTLLNAISREAYDEAHNKPTQDEAAAEAEEAGQEHDKKMPKRPAMPAASKRGSFVGVVGGLETGAYGGLAAVSRHLIGVPGAAAGSKGSSAAKSAQDDVDDGDA
ncbi:related to ACT1-Actin [Sporisorium reilianum f. sp. reilianum]|uniref:Related to ACT1-Actin n=1 Tax=Sporisorium reilianum f. sp. reilianum TaxID=72559 RepID=A0A2N8UMD4_9BASI|nr:related to ACT1-Actin [Sporisorium reilianum f. sp. reilianum]